MAATNGPLSPFNILKDRVVYFAFFSPCPLPECGEFADQALTWTIEQCRGKAFLGDNGCFICQHMVSGQYKGDSEGLKAAKGCPKGFKECTFYDMRFKCQNHGMVPKRVTRDHITSAMFHYKEVAFISAPTGVEKRAFMRWLTRTASAVTAQYSADTAAAAPAAPNPRSQSRSPFTL